MGEIPVNYYTYKEGSESLGESTNEWDLNQLFAKTLDVLGLDWKVAGQQAVALALLPNRFEVGLDGNLFMDHLIEEGNYQSFVRVRQRSFLQTSKRVNKVREILIADLVNQDSPKYRYVSFGSRGWEFQEYRFLDTQRCKRWGNVFSDSVYSNPEDVGTFYNLLDLLQDRVIYREHTNLEPKR